MTDGVEEAVYRLLYHRSFRAAFVREGGAALGLPDDVAAALAAVELDQLEGMARSIERAVRFGGGAEGDGLLATFPGVLAELAAEGRTEEAVIAAFLESEAFGDYRPLPFAGDGVCLPEAFHRWLAGEPGWDAPRRRFLLDHEFLVALMTLLSTNHDPSFVVRTPLVTRSPAAWYAVRAVAPAIAAEVAGFAAAAAAAANGEEVHVLYAAAGSRRIIGPVPPLVGALVALGERARVGAQAAALGERFSAAAARVELVAGRLHEIGLLA